MSEKDQASGLRKWADLQRQQQHEEAPADAVKANVAAAEHMPEHTSPLLAPTIDVPKVAEVEEPTVPARAKIPLVVVGLPGSGAPNVHKVKARLEQWSALGRSWAGDPDDWDIRIVMAGAANLAQLRDDVNRWALWVNSDADAFAAMYRTLRQLREGGGPSRLLALHEPHLPRQGLLDNLREAADYYLNMQLLVLAR